MKRPNVTFDSTGDTFVLENLEYVSFMSRFYADNDDSIEELKEVFRKNQYRPLHWFPIVLTIGIIVAGFFVLFTILSTFKGV